MSEAIVGIWLIVVTVLGLNGFAAGMAAALYIWRRGMRRGARIASASTLAGLLPASIFIVAGASELFGASALSEEPVVWVVVVGLVLVVAGVVSLPGALVVGRKLEQPGSEYRAFE
jgi:hypothetical protein